MADFNTRPTFRVRDSGQLLVCKCGCDFCRDAAEPRCVCGNRRGSHDIDGQRDDCDGYVEAK